MTDRKRMGLAMGGLAGIGAVAAVLWWQQAAQPALPAGGTARPAMAVLPSQARPDAPAPDAGPRFDVARVSPKGGAVVAGRAAPGAEVVLQDHGRELGRAQADAQGEFVILPAERLAPGTHALSLRARGTQGQDSPGTEAVVVVVPDTARDAAGTGTPVAVLLPATEAAPPRLLQGGAPVGDRRLALDLVDYDAAGGMRFSGSGPAGGTVRAYVDQRHAGDVTVDGTGRWTLLPLPVPGLGRHLLRLDHLGPQGRVVARLELPIQRDDASVAAMAEGQMVVQPGHNLWRIARETYGRGIRYTTIHRANADQIRDPALIYPGQIFTLPTP